MLTQHSLMSNAEKLGIGGLGSFSMPFERHYSETANSDSAQNNSISGPDPEGMPALYTNARKWARSTQVLSSEIFSSLSAE